MNSEGNILEKYMKEWLMSNDTLTIPDFGTFHSQYQSASVQAGVHKIMPPNKIISFDTNKKEDDGELLSFLVQNKHLELDEAQMLIKEYVNFVQEDLFNKKKYIAYGLGIWFLKPDHSISFQTEEDTNMSAESFGLGTVYTAPINKASMPQNPIDDVQESIIKDFDEDEKVKQKQEKNNNENQKPKTNAFGFDENDDEFYDEDDIVVEEEIIEKNKRQKYTVAALVLLLLFIGIGFTLVFFPEVFGTRKKQSIAEKEQQVKDTIDKKQAFKEPNDTEEPEEEKGEKTEKDAKEKSNKEDTKKTETPEARKKRLEARKRKIQDLPEVSGKDLEKTAGDNTNPPKNLKDIEVKNKGNKFYVVIASFDTEPKAYKYINHLQKKGFNNLKLIKGTSNRVSIGEFAATADAQKRKIEIAKKYSLESWVLKH